MLGADTKKKSTKEVSGMVELIGRLEVQWQDFYFFTGKNE